MIFNYIAFGLAGLFLLLSLISVIAEAVSPYHKPTRRLRITLREVTKLPFVVIAGIVLLIGNKVSGAKFQFTAIALGIFLHILVRIFAQNITPIWGTHKLAATIYGQRFFNGFAEKGLGTVNDGVLIGLG